jgi:hypothetical protein
MTGARHAKIVVAGLLAWWSFLPACKSCGEKPTHTVAGRPSLAGVTVKPIAPVVFLGTEIQLDPVDLAAKAKKVLTDAQVFAPPETDRPTAQVSLTIDVFSVSETAQPEIGAKVRLRITVRPSAVPARFSEDVEAVGQAPMAESDGARAAFQHLAERTVGDLLLAFVSRQKLWEGSIAEIAAALKSAESDVRVEALRIIAARGLRAEIPPVLHLLSDEDENVRDAALGTLVALHERGAVKVLAESRHMRDAREMRKILDAIATLGGREAQEYLSFVAETHDDEEIRDMAKAAMDRLERHAESKRPTK